jgi:type VI secretion system protein ImpA
MTTRTQNLPPASDLAALLEPVEASDEVGPDLDGTLEMSAFEAAVSEPDGPSIAGVEAGDERDWRAIDREAQKLLARSKDVRLAVVLARARLHKGGLGELSEALCFVAALSERFWSAIHPQLEEDGDTTARINALQALVSPPLLAQLRSTRIASIPGLGVLTVKEAVADNLPSRVQAIFKALAEDGLRERLEQVSAARGALTALSELVRENSGIPARFTSLTAPRGEKPGILDALERALSEALGRVAKQEAVEPVVEAAQTQAVGAEHVASGTVNSRDDVLKTLERVCDYYTRVEPSSPVPLLLRRAQRLVTMDFLDLMRDLAREGLPEVAKLAGIELEAPALAAAPTLGAFPDQEPVSPAFGNEAAYGAPPNGYAGLPSF